MANDEELVASRVAVAHGGVEYIFRILDHVRGYVEIVYSLLVSGNDHGKNVTGGIPVVSKSK